LNGTRTAIEVSTGSTPRSPLESYACNQPRARAAMCVRATRATGAALGLLASFCLAVAQRPPKAQFSEDEDSLKRFLQRGLKEPSLDDDKTTKYLAAFVDLNGDGISEAIVYVTGQTWCGSGGCNLLILARSGASWKKVTAMTITRTPIRVLTRASNGWRNITVLVQGGGIQPGYEAELQFDGKTYPTNPSVPPARRLTREVAGQIVLASSQDGTPLWPDDGR
jgi:hypothetical protein